ncbi:thioredoxin domain-containing protein [Aliifodinibius sp. S!AR15-10]|uniref:thioredoxin domain-containing protein n=1 Tax=Aliifodinibius sp. S!AR15-10 TaxID=2950437 RepID=UPI0028663141|nr:thioredoxin domain-containing protein [Aliifodinibius sp. S!AR15-10]MDR8392752.1 thioredoxin domain-containing protein [Aliifodinibius sp. S!AR15-10]
MAQNQLAAEKSPYLQQHADNPVQWYAWGKEAFEAAKQQDKPILLSIGYATCHWCHVMAHESFEDEEVAKLMNDTFINIKVDREERPDIDNTYMTVCQMMTGSGGWPLTIFMTPEKKPFYAATYIPKRGRQGRPGMMELIPWLKNLWDENRKKIHRSADEIANVFQKSNAQKPGGALDENILKKAFHQFKQQFDRQHGGFGDSPKFPSPHNLMFLLRLWKQSGDDQALVMVEQTLEAMRCGGVYDHVGFGFHRYSTDARWLLPHFEKMLYDQAMLMMAYTEGWQATGNKLFKQTVDEIATYLFRDLQDKSGGFYSAEDADSEGEEGKFYVWSTDEIRNLLPVAEAELFIEVFNLEQEGNFKEEATGQRVGKNIPHLQKSLGELAEEREMEPETLREKLESIRQTLFKEREKRVRPFLDDKILTDWNGLAIAALAKAGKVLGNQEYIDRAEQAFQFISEKLQKEDGSLLHRYRDGDAAIDGHVDDYAFLVWGLLELYEATFKTNYLQEAIRLNEILLEQFWDEENGGFYFTAHDSEELLGRKKEAYDGALPSGNSVAMLNLVQLGRITANTDLEEKAEQIGRLFSNQLSEAPTGFGQMLQAVGFGLGESYEIVIAGKRNSDDTEQLLKEVSAHFIPNKVVILNDPKEDAIHTLAPYTKQQNMKEDKATAYVCRNYSCEQPVTEADEMAELLKET